MWDAPTVSISRLQFQQDNSHITVTSVRNMINQKTRRIYISEAGKITGALCVLAYVDMIIEANIRLRDEEK